MKTFKKCGLALAMAAALVMTTGLTACSSENDLVETPNSTAKGVTVTVSAGISDDATTRSEVATEDGKRVLKFTTGDRLYVYREISSQYALAGMLDMVGSPSADGKSASFTGTIKVYDNELNEIGYELGSDPLAGTTATLVHKNHNSDAIYITVGRGVVLNYAKMSGDDLESVMTSCLFVQGSYDDQKYTLGSYNPIFNCTFSGLDASTEYMLKIVHEDDYNNSFEDTPGKFTTDANCVGRLAFISVSSGNYKWKLVVKSSDGSTTIGEIKLGDYKTTISKKVYNVKRNYGRAAFGKFIDISTLDANYVAQDGDVLSGSLTNNVKISIADGAKVTLDDVTINGTNSDSYLWAGITCLGDATIVLSGTNTVKGFDWNYPGVYVPENKTLTINGTGSLDASSNGYAAGIGSGCPFFEPTIGTCGNITIEGGTITATGGRGAAGIGGASPDGYTASTCGNIRITGGTVTATGGSSAAGIGSGDNGGSCGTITIANTVTRVTASANNGAAISNYCSIGKGGNGTCGTVTIGSAECPDGISENPFTYAPVDATGHALSASVLGEMVGTDGLAYAVSKYYLPTGVTAAGMVAYKSGSIGLVIALRDETDFVIWNGAGAAAAAHTPVVTGQTWKLPSEAEWKQMFAAFGGSDSSYSGLNTAITNAGGTVLSGSHWSADNYRYFTFESSKVFWNINGDNALSLLVRACLAF